MSEAVLIALLGAVFNAGVLWGTMQAFRYRLTRVEKRTENNERRLNRVEFRAAVAKVKA